VLDASGTPGVLLESVGVGQVEVEVAANADTTMVVVNPGWGDAVQANKAGLMEIADLFVINKSDRPGAREAERDLQQMLDMSDVGEWRPPIVNAVATAGDGVDQVWAEVERHRAHLEETGGLAERRARRLAGELQKIVVARLEQQVADVCQGETFDRLHADVMARRTDPWSAAAELLEAAGL
jgi:LAO/AO transport system kinase